MLALCMLLSALTPAIHLAPTLRARVHGSPVCCALPPRITVAVTLEDGGSDVVTLASADDASRVAASLAARHALSPEQAAALQDDLAAQWEDGCQNAPDIYCGPMCEDNELRNPVASVTLESVGLVLEVAESVVANGGLGLFVRCLGEDTEQVTVDEGTAVCGYCEGTMRAAAESDKAVAFALASPESVVWFERELRTVADVLADESVEEIAGHVAERTAAGELSGIALDAAWDGPRYFVPSEPQPSPLPVTALGQMANDLAIGNIADESDDATYDRQSGESNLLCLVFRLERDEQRPGLLLPSRPISTMSRSITFVNDVPMELGCRCARARPSEPVPAHERGDVRTRSRALAQDPDPFLDSRAAPRPIRHTTPSLIRAQTDDDTGGTGRMQRPFVRVWTGALEGRH